MLGWEFPPMVSGGLGVACYGLVKALNGMGVDVLFLLPKPLGADGNGRADERRVGEARGAESESSEREAAWNRASRILARVREVKAASAQDVQQAVEKSTARLEALRATDRPPGKGPASGESTGAQAQWQRQAAAARGAEMAIEGQPSQGEKSSTHAQDEALQRVVFFPVDVLLHPYMTPSQYQKMVVEEASRGDVARSHHGRKALKMSAGDGQSGRLQPVGSNRHCPGRHREPEMPRPTPCTRPRHSRRIPNYTGRETARGNAHSSTNPPRTCTHTVPNTRSMPAICLPKLSAMPVWR